MSGFTLHLLRHGALEQPGLMMGRTDGAPTAAGIAACVAQTANIGIEQLIASDLQRASRAGAAIGDAIALPPVIDPRWRELDFGDWDGQASGTVDPDALGAFWDDPDANPPPGGERWSSLVARVSAALADLAPRTTLVVTHGGTMRAALHLLCGFDQPQLWAFDLPYAARLSLQIWPGERPSAQIIGLAS